MAALTFSGTPSEVWIGDAGYETADGEFRYSISGGGIGSGSTSSFSRALRIEPISGSTTIELSLRRESIESGSEGGVCFVNDAGSGFSIYTMGTTITARLEVLGSGSTTLDTATVSQDVGLDLYTYSYNPTTKAISVTLAGVEVLATTYTGTETGLRPGFQIWRPSAAVFSVESFDAVPAAVANPGIRLKIVDASFADSPDLTGVTAVVRAAINSTAVLYETASATITGGYLVIDDDSVGAIDAEFYVALKKAGATTADDKYGSGEGVVVDLNTEDES